MELDDTEKQVMDALTRSTTTPSVVTLAADLWMPHTQNLGADPIGLVQWVLEGLGVKGLVTYTEGTSTTISGHGHPWDGLAKKIRLTKAGWLLMGYGQRWVQVNTRMSTNVHWKHEGDRTNFRRHGDTAEGGVILTETFAEHRVHFPHHVHPLMYGDEMATRRYVKITEELEQSIVKYKDEHPDASVADISEALAFTERTIKYVLYDLPRIRHNSNEPKSDASTKMRIALALRATSYANVTELRKDLGRSEDSHSIVHLLHSLHSEGKVDFSEKAGRNEPINISLTQRGHGWLATQEADQAAIDARIADAKDEPLPAFVQERIPEQLTTRQYPELDALLAREKQRLDSDNRAMRYIEAAELIRDNDPETAALLDTKAAESDIPFPSPLEAEYLQYVADHE